MAFGGGELVEKQTASLGVYVQDTAGLGFAVVGQGYRQQRAGLLYPFQQAGYFAAAGDLGVQWRATGDKRGVIPDSTPKQWTKTDWWSSAGALPMRHKPCRIDAGRAAHPPPGGCSGLPRQ